jgi:hypothetical protein
VVVAILDAGLEVTDALVDGDIDLRGSTEAVSLMIMAIDILVDAATRVPALRSLADRYRAEHEPAVAAGSRFDRGLRPRTRWPPSFVDADEDEMLRQLGLDIGEPWSTMDPGPTT